MILKPGVKIQGMRPELNFGLQVANEVYAIHDTNMVVTSVVDGKHSSTSLHYSGCAADLRTRNLPAHVSPHNLAREIKERLGIDFDVIAESDHIHMEYQPRCAT